MSADDEKVEASTAEDEFNGVRTGTAAVVAAVWCELFGVPRVDPDDDFFAMGGHSMLAVRMSSRLRTELGLRVPVRTILENPTVDGLSQLLAEAVESATDPAGD
ncbi:phosphopantetheine-binding protein [Kibdelosporangium philippinense]|uniref:Phosphopantetheine-binding protein n=1 Tax=Kibdelosporangium philippinense TaxID=211113 RepID=A0ABS8ZA21_9PSEU|nr:phosphopantetheine-binding protein [Kibdelosporangium philippinense]MCE7004710.1 phosphopantetheine-binding protein [Kibdelosporangium philippinense]